MGDVGDLEDRFKGSCRAAFDYPCNLVFPRIYEHLLVDYREQLEQRASGIFCIDSKTAIDFLELDSELEGFQSSCVYTYGELDSQLRLQECRADPICRYVFISAPNARDKLRTDREMFLRILSYHQVMPSFLEFVFSFGAQERAADFHFCGFRSEIEISSARPRLHLPSLRRSGREFRLCYNLRSVEKTSLPASHWPWSIRQCAVYHCFDVSTEAATWVLIKANRVIKTRVESLIDCGQLYGTSTTGIETSALQSTLDTHLLIVSWSAEQWRWYINFLEERFQQISERALTESVDLTSLRQELSAQRSTGNGLSGPVDPKVDARTSFDQLQDVHHIEEKTNEALLVVQADLDVLLNLDSFYNEVATELQEEHRPEDCRDMEICSFRREIAKTRRDLTVQQRRLETLLRLLEGRKSLLRSMLQHRNTLMNFILADKAQESAENVERMTKGMHSIARSTKLETVSMRIITFVTLVYLPGTFVSTLMSTPVVTFRPADFSEHGRHISPDALGLFLAISLPLLFFTVAMWWFFMTRQDRKDNKTDEDP